jgi:aconitate hydratase
MAFDSFKREIDVNSKTFHYYAINELDKVRYEKLPISIRYLLESAVRCCDDFHVLRKDVETILNWETTQHEDKEIPFRPARVLLQDFTGKSVILEPKKVLKIGTFWHFFGTFFGAKITHYLLVFRQLSTWHP